MNIMIHEILKKSKTAVVIGAMDGIYFDEIDPALPKYNLEKVVMVEPIPWHFETLVNNYTQYPNFEFENSAVTMYNGKVSMITIPPQNFDKVGAWAVGCSMIGSQYKTELGTNLLGDFDIVKFNSIQVEVNAITFKNLLLKHNLTTVDFIKVDAEGHDWVIVSQIDLDIVKPIAVYFEIAHLSKETLKIAIQWFNKSNYDFYNVGDDAHEGCAVKRGI